MFLFCNSGASPNDFADFPERFLDGGGYLFGGGSCGSPERFEDGSDVPGDAIFGQGIRQSRFVIQPNVFYVQLKE
jgi:hypothetical protein